MILVDTSIWIDHLHERDGHLGSLLERDEVASHPLVIEELALGSIRRRDDVLTLLGNLNRFPSASHEELLALVGHRRLWGRGLSAVDAHLLASVLLVPGSRLWTRDRRLRSAADGLGVAHDGG